MEQKINSGNISKKQVKIESPKKIHATHSKLIKKVLTNSKQSKVAKSSLKKISKTNILKKNKKVSFNPAEDKENEHENNSIIQKSESKPKESNSKNSFQFQNDSKSQPKKELKKASEHIKTPFKQKPETINELKNEINPIPANDEEPAPIPAQDPNFLNTPVLAPKEESEVQKVENASKGTKDRPKTEMKLNFSTIEEGKVEDENGPKEAKKEDERKFKDCLSAPSKISENEEKKEEISATEVNQFKEEEPKMDPKKEENLNAQMFT